MAVQLKAADLPRATHDVSVRRDTERSESPGGITGAGHVRLGADRAESPDLERLLWCDARAKAHAGNEVRARDRASGPAPVVDRAGGTLEGEGRPRLLALGDRAEPAVDPWASALAFDRLRRGDRAYERRRCVAQTPGGGTRRELAIRVRSPHVPHDPPVGVHIARDRGSDWRELATRKQGRQELEVPCRPSEARSVEVEEALVHKRCPTAWKRNLPPHLPDDYAAVGDLVGHVVPR